MKKTYILAIDTSCDDTSVAVLRNDNVLSTVIASQEEIHQPWGGVFPRLARRAHIENIDATIELALKKAQLKEWSKIDAIAVTYGPGLAPCLEVGLLKAKELSEKHNKPLIPINHMEGHILSPFLRNSNGKYYINNLPQVHYPLIALTVSGGHTDLVWMEGVGNYRILGETLDDAAGEAFDKIARMMELGFPGGPILEEIGAKGDPSKIDLPLPMAKKPNYHFSYSGLKTACLYLIRDLKEEHQENFPSLIPDICASAQEAIVDSLLLKLKRACRNMPPSLVVIVGGVSANKRLRLKARKILKKLNIPVAFPEKKFCTDNAAMIGLAGYHRFQRGEFLEDFSGVDRSPSITIEKANGFVFGE